MSIDQDLEVEAYYLVNKIKQYEKSKDPWRDKAEAFDFLEMFHNKMYNLLVKFANRYNSFDNED